MHSTLPAIKRAKTRHHMVDGLRSSQPSRKSSMRSGIPRGAAPGDFENVTPAIRSKDVSFDNRRGSDFYAFRGMSS
ncbi:hypothetical protein [uncultured Gimesia sp.]|uniref:hypothetical protein n=1 Tax=uncultured Gimesia sp. TaxID=1678688 RepID=UPI002601DF49|nr:hypothetical protein [uncultured Gimesia sp.]